MKKFFFQIFKVPMFLVFLLMFVCFGFKALGSPAAIDQFAIVTAVGIDRAPEDEKCDYEISFLTFVPVAEQNFTENYEVISAMGCTFSEALDFVGMHVGKEIGLSHLKLVVLSEELLNEDVSQFLDYLTRNKHIASSTKLITTPDSAKDFLMAAQALDSDNAFKVSELVSFNDDYIYAADSSFETFFKGTLGPTRVGLLPELSLGQEQGIPVAASGSEGGEGGGSSGASGENAQKIDGKQIINNGDTIACKDGKMVHCFCGNTMKHINLMRGNFSTGTLEVDHITEGELQDAKLTFEIFSKKLKTKIEYVNGIPEVYFDIKLQIKLCEVRNKGGMFQENVNFFVISKDIEDKLEETIKFEMLEGLDTMREYQIDVIDLYTKLHNKDKKAFEKFLDTLEDKDDYLNHIVFKASINLVTK